MSGSPLLGGGVAGAAGSGPVAAYSFDQGSGSTLQDLSGNGNNGTISGAAWTTAGKSGSALTFNGSSSTVSVPDSPSLDLTSAMTVEAWVRPTALGTGWRTAVLKEQSSPTELTYGLYANTDTTQPGGNVFVGSDVFTRGGSTPLSTWTHIAATYDGSTLRVYVNAAQVASQPISGPIATSSGPLKIGGNAIWGEFFQGQIDDVRIYNRQLTASEIGTDMNTAVGAVAPAPPPPPPPAPAPTGLVGAYSFDEGSGTTLRDLSGNGNNGTISGAAWTTAGKFGSALTFNGTSSTVAVPDSASLDLTSRMTLEAWVKPSALGTAWRTAVLKEQSSPTELTYALYANTDTTQPGGNVFVGSDTFTRGGSTPLNAWTHVASTYDGSMLRVYVNGAQVSSMGVAGSIAASSGPLKIGGNAIWGEYFQGQIDEVRVYNTALSAAAITTDMNTAVGGGTAAPPPPSGDTQAPTAPGGLTVTGSTSASASVSWTASSDNVGVTGYGLYQNGASAGSTAGTSFTYSGLACGTSYALAVDAVDAAGNRSAKSSVSATTPACPASGGGTASVFVATNGSDGNSCTSSAPCRSFDRAYRVAQPGQIVQVAGGTYPDQQINSDSSKTSSSDVVFQPAPNSSVTINGSLALGNGQGTPAASHLTIRDIRATSEIQAFTPAKDLTWDHVSARNFYFRGIQNVLVSGGNFGPCTSSVDPCGNNKIDMASSPEQPNANITIDGASIHDFRVANLTDHFECMILFGGTNITVRNSKFWNCEFYDIFIQFAGEGFNGLRLENNWFDEPWNGQQVQNRVSALGFSPRGYSFTDVLVRYNSFHSDTSISWNEDGSSPSYSNFRVVGNIIGRPNGCNNSITYAFNVFGNGTCGSTDRSVSSLPYQNGGHGPNWDWHLTGGMPVDLVPGSTSDQQVAGDIDGLSRPMGAGYDAGADELR